MRSTARHLTECCHKLSSEITAVKSQTTNVIEVSMHAIGLFNGGLALGLCEFSEWGDLYL